MVRRSPDMRSVMRPVVIVIALLASLNLVLVGLVCVEQPVPAGMSTRFAIRQQLVPLNAGADWARLQWKGFRERLEHRATAAHY